MEFINKRLPKLSVFCLRALPLHETVEAAATIFTMIIVRPNYTEFQVAAFFYMPRSIIGVACSYKPIDNQAV
jgi:hypothetical protein